MTNEENTTANIPQKVYDLMMENDYFSKWLGLEFIAIGEGTCTLKFTVRREMLNGFHSIHGGVLFSAADSAFAFSCNSCGRQTVALDCNINYARPAFEGEILIVDAHEITRGRTTGIYEIKITNEDEKLVAIFRGTAYDTGKIHEIN